MRVNLIAGALGILLSISANAFSQGGFATVTGSVADSSGALIPGVTIKATAADTGVVTTKLSNETGAYNFPSLLPGKYTLSASLAGLTTQNITDVVLGAAQSYRYNFKMTISTSSTTVDVSISAQNIMATSGATIGQALNEQKVRDLPLVGNNVLGLIGTLSGVENIQNGAFGRESTTFAGISAQNIATVRDGVIVSDTRYPTGINSATVINPDLVGEVRLILAPVDAELGRGNGTVQITTRSGTNKFTGSAVWTIRNSALNPNTWANNSNRTLPPGTPAGTTPSATPVNWNNTNQGTVSYGGPIVRNKTFFFTLFDFNQSLQRSSTNFTVLTPCARKGIVRYFDGWNNGNALATTVSTGANPTTNVVELDGSPRSTLTTRPNGTTSSALQARSVFGTLSAAPAANDCSGAAINASTLVPAGAASGWDPNRVALDTTGFINRTMAFMPLPNNYEIGDGLNTAGFRWLRHNTGLDNLFSVGEDTGIRKQINVKIDQNFNERQKANVNVSYERVHSDDVYQGWPGTFSNENFHHPLVITSAFTSTLSPTLLNEARFGYKETGTNVIAPWARPELQADINAYLPPDVNGTRILPRAGGALGFCYPITGARPPGGCTGGSLTAVAYDHTPSLTFGDTLSWTVGNHALKFGYELRENNSTSHVNTVGFFSNFGTEVQAVGGQAPGAPQALSGGSGINSSNTIPFGTLGNLTAGTSRNVLDFLSGSMASINQLYWITDPNNLANWSDYRTEHELTTPLHQTEMSAFAKDDYKVTKNLTLNLGLRWEYFGVPYNTRGITVSPVGGSDAVFGISGRSFDNFWAPPAVGSSGTNTSATYDPSLVTAEQFVGPNSPNSGRDIYPNDLNNFGPSIGFSWQVPFFGEGKTTVRGGYQLTYQGGGRFSAIEGVISAPPGSTSNATYADPTNLYLDLTDLGVSVPVPPTNQPMAPIRVTDRSQNLSVIDSHYTTPYVQNLTMSVTRQVSRNFQMDISYIGTLAVKQYRTLGQFNSANFFNNGLTSEFNSIRTGGDSALLDSMFSGINLCAPNTLTGLSPCGGASSNYGAIGTTVGVVPQTAAQQMRLSPTFNTNLANGNYSAIAGSINTLNYVKPAAGTACTIGAAGNCSLPDLPVGIDAVRGAAMRFSGLFPENYLTNNPQYNNVSYLTNLDHNNYHSLQVEGTYRPIQGVSLQGTYTFSKNLGLVAGNYTDPTNRRADYTIVNSNRPHTIRTNGTFELPVGPNKLLFGNSSGAVARAIERWQLGLIYNYNTGSYTSIAAQSMMYANGTADVVDTPFTRAALDALQNPSVTWNTRIPTGYQGRYFGDRFAGVDDPQCATVTPLQNLNGGATPRCTLNALAYIVPDGTPGAITITDTIAVDNPASPGNTMNQTRVRQGLIVLQNPLPGNRGTLGMNTIRNIGNFTLDANISKQFRISESRSFQLRIDTTNVLNHPMPGTPNFNMNSNNPFGQITTKTGTRAFQGQVRFNF